MGHLSKFTIITTALLAVFSVVSDAVAVTPYSWSNVKIGGGGFIPGIIYSPTQQGLVYVRTDIGGAYRWDTTSSKWIPITDIFNDATSNLLGAESIATDPKDPSRVYIAVGQYVESWAGNGAIIASKDQGNTWTSQWNAPFQMGSNEDGRGAGERLAVNPVDNSILFFGSRTAGLWKSSDYAATFTQVTSFPTPPTSGKGIVFVQFVPNTGGLTLFAGVEDVNNPLYRSTDGGNTWASVTGQPTGNFAVRSAFSSDGLTFYVTYSNGPGPNSVTNGAVWKLTLSSSQWTNITPVTPNSGSNPSLGYSGVSTDGTNPKIVIVSTIDDWGAGDDIYRSLDGGSTWKSLKSTAVLDISVSPWLNFGASAAGFGWWTACAVIDPFNSNTILYGTGATLYASSDVTNADSGEQTHWAPLTNGLEETAVQDLASPPTGPALFSAQGDIGGFTHDSVTVAPPMWNTPTFGTGSSVNFAGQLPSFVVRSGSQGGDNSGSGGAYSTDSGKTWTSFASTPTGASVSGRIAVSADGKAIVWTPYQAGAYWSQDNGNTWTAVSGLSPNTLTIIADGWLPSTFYAYDTGSGSLWASTDYGKTFSKRATNVISGSGTLNAVYGSKGAGDLWLAANDGLHHSTDGGNTFTLVSGVSSAQAVGFGAPAAGSSYSVAVYIAGYVNSFYGVYRSVDGGATWTQLNDATHQWGWIGAKIIGDPKVFGRVYIATNGRGIILGDDATVTATTSKSTTTSKSATTSSTTTSSPKPTTTSSSKPTTSSTTTSSAKPTTSSTKPTTSSTKPTTSSTKSTTTSSSPSPTATNCSTVWGQCGGIGWSGATCCAAGSACVTQSGNLYYSQCLPN